MSALIFLALKGLASFGFGSLIWRNSSIDSLDPHHNAPPSREDHVASAVIRVGGAGLLLLGLWLVCLTIYGGTTLVLT